MRLIGPEVHALSGPRPHQMGCLAYYPSYPSLWGVVIYSCLFEHWKGKAYMRDVFLHFFACFAAARCIGWTRRVLHKQPWWKWLLAPCVASSVASLDTKVPPSVPPSAFHKWFLPYLWSGRSYTSIIWRALALWEKLEKVWTTMPTNGHKKPSRWEKREEQNLGIVWHSVAIALIRWGHCPHQLHPRWCVWSIVWTCVTKAGICLCGHLAVHWHSFLSWILYEKGCFS